jgi:hypothetical protein
LRWKGKKMTKVTAKKSFTYCGALIEPGEVFDLTGALNDSKLLACGHVTEMPEGTQAFECSACGKQFSSGSALTVHVNKHINEAIV